MPAKQKHILSSHNPHFFHSFLYAVNRRNRTTPQLTGWFVRNLVILFSSSVGIWTCDHQSVNLSTRPVRHTQQWWLSRSVFQISCQISENGKNKSETNKKKRETNCIKCELKKNPNYKPLYFSNSRISVVCFVLGIVMWIKHISVKMIYQNKFPNYLYNL